MSVDTGKADLALGRIEVPEVRGSTDLAPGFNQWQLHVHSFVLLRVQVEGNASIFLHLCIGSSVANHVVRAGS